MTHLRFLWLILLLLFVTPFAHAKTEQYDTFELSLPGPTDGNPFVDVAFSARFASGERSFDVPGFYDGDGTYRVRFMPPSAGTWRYETRSKTDALNGRSGEFDCVKPSPKNHGPVVVRNTHHFAYADGTPYKPIGTTSYGWVFQPEEMEDQTLATLRASPFNKLRMCLMTIPYGASNDPPTAFPFRRRSETDWDFSRFDVKFFQHLDRRIRDLGDAGIEADVILFNPYNAKLGFGAMTDDDDDRYVRYLIARLGAYRNVWWSLANEYDLIRTRTRDDWDRIGKLIAREDPNGHLRSIHFSHEMFDPHAPWITHLSIQNGAAVADFGRASLYRDVCAKPVVYDEVCYEGTMDRRWGQLDGQEMTHRFWLGTIGGTYVTHGEVFKDPESKAWTARGIALHGESPKRIDFLRKILADAPADGIEPIDRFFESNIAGKLGEYYLIYFGNDRPTEWRFALYKDKLADGMKFKVDLLDTWNMTITPVEQTFTIKKLDNYVFGPEGDVKIALPGTAHIALRIRRVP